MMNRLIDRIVICAVLAASFSLAGATTAAAQFKPRVVQEQTTSERYHVEGAVEAWFPDADMTVRSAGTGALAGLAGTEINAARDLGLGVERSQLPQFELVLRPA